MRHCANYYPISSPTTKTDVLGARQLLTVSILTGFLSMSISSDSGGSNWGGVAYDPESGLAVVNSTNILRSQNFCNWTERRYRRIRIA